MLFRQARLWCLVMIGVAAAAGCGAGPREEADDRLQVFAAASLIDVMGEIATDWEEAGHPAPVFNFAGTSQLAQQLKQGADADVFVSADEAWVDEVAAAGLIDAPTRAVVARNALVLVSAVEQAEMEMGNDIAASLESLISDGRLAMAEPSVPAGRYAQEALESMGLWSMVQEQSVYAPDVRAALRLVELGEATAGIVYRTDAIAAGGRVRVVGEFPAGSHTPIHYPAAAIVGGDGGAFAAFLLEDAAQSKFEALGFGVD